jgi:hypothetical protein
MLWGPSGQNRGARRWHGWLQLGQVGSATKWDRPLSGFGQVSSAKWDRGARRRHRCLKPELELGNHHLPPPHPCPQQRCSAAWSLPRTAWQSHAVGLRPVHRLPWGADEHSNGMRSPWGFRVSALGFTVRIARICMNANDSPMHVCCPAPNPMNEYLRACVRKSGCACARRHLQALLRMRACVCARLCR